MASLKPVIRKGELNTTGKANIKIRISHKGKVRYVASPWYIDPDTMLGDGSVKNNHSLNSAISSLLQEYYNILAAQGTAIVNCDVNMLASMLRGNSGEGVDFIAYTRQRIRDLRRERRQSLADLYEVTLKHIQRYHPGSVAFSDITPGFLAKFERQLRSGGLSVNTVRNYMCNIRAVFNHAIDADRVKQEVFPFRKYRIIQERKRPRVIDVTDMRRLYMAQPYLTKAEQRAVDVFLLIFYLGGINLKDLLYLKQSDYYKGRIYYRRFKTGRDYSVKVFSEAAEIIKLYQGNRYVLNLIENKALITPVARKGYEHKDILRNTNKYLKQAGEAIGLKIRLNTYVARYSFATIASAAGVDKDVIAQILGHGLSTMTDLYIDFDQARADIGLEKVILLIKS